MGCSSCSSGGGQPKGCRNNGTCGTSGCNKFTVFDWLANMESPNGQQAFDWAEVRFKNGRKDFYKNVNNITLQPGDIVAVEASPGHDIGVISVKGDLVRLQMRKNNFDPEDPNNLKKLYRKANQKDIDLWTEARDREGESMYKSRVIADGLGLNMKISDVEYQGDGQKATFYYTAESRVDFRQLIRDLASEFGVRIEMRQIGARQEAARLGGIGSCGRELCCSTWLTDFRTVNTSAARYQQLALNPAKLAGQCGKLKCCLNYELDSYLEALNDFPDTTKALETQRGRAFFQKKDIFKRIMWYAYEGEALTWVPLSVDDVKTIITANEKSEKPASLEMFKEDTIELEPQLTDVVGQDDLTRFDRKTKPKRRKKPTANATKERKPSPAGTPPRNVRNQPVQVKNNPKPSGTSKDGQLLKREPIDPSASTGADRKKRPPRNNYRRRPNNPKPGSQDE